MEKYQIIKTLGDGAFGTVYKATNSKTGEVVAIKKMKQKYTNWNECIQLRQIKSLRKIDHPNIIKLREVLLVSQELCMVFEYLQYNLYEVYSKMKTENKRLTQKQIKSIVQQIASGLAGMHKNGFFHRDMKPQNLLIYNNVVKICDLGLAREIRSRPPYTDYVSTRWYRAPELLLRATNYNSPVDIFALGCIMAELYTMTPLFPGSNQIDQLNKIVKIIGTPSKEDWPQGYKLAQQRGFYFPDDKGVNLADLIPDASPQAIDLIQSMLQYSSRKRPTALEILKHDYFKGVATVTLQAPGKEVIFTQKPMGTKLDTKKQDKKIQQFRATKQKFRKTRNQDAKQSNLFNKIDQINRSGQGQDIDSILNYLQNKNKKKDAPKLPVINNTRDKFYKPPQKIANLRQAKTDIRPSQAYNYGRQDWMNLKLNPKSLDEREKSRRQEQNLYKKKYQPAFNPVLPPSKKESMPAPNKFSYGFQPAPIQLLPARSNSNLPGGGLGFLSLAKPANPFKKQPLQPLLPYKY